MDEYPQAKSVHAPTRSFIGNQIRLGRPRILKEGNPRLVPGAAIDHDVALLESEAEAVR